MNKFSIFLIAFVAFSTSDPSLFAQCEGAHSALEDDAWLSCQGTENPNTERTQEHWILYDFGDYYFLNESHFWNYNFIGSTDNGIATATIDLSVNGTDWMWWGDFNLEEAPGSDSYYGETGPDFDGIVARYLLISVVTNHGGNCYGFSELQLQVDPGVIGINDPELQALGFSIHPNPAKDFTTVQLNGDLDSEIRLLSPSGELISTRRTNSESTDIDLQGLSSGVYMIEVIRSDGVRTTQRLTVVH
jgi:hypothetical protein|tara:strand:- start:60 stop:797 length:738 start_codon:yes stop_codon:yes gene_type:complete